MSNSSSSNKALFKFIRGAFSVLIVVMVVYATVQLSAVGYDFGYRVFTEPAMSAEPGVDIPVLIKEGMSDRDIAKTLEEKGLIRDKNLGFLQIKLSAYSGEAIPGAYTLNTSMDMKEILITICTEEETSDEESAAESEGTATVDTDDEVAVPVSGEDTGDDAAQEAGE